MKWSTKTCLVTGAAGFIGSRLTRELVRLGSKVVALDNLSYGTLRNLDDVRCKFIEGDVSDWNVLEGIRPKPNFVFHFGSPSSIVLFNRDPISMTKQTITTLVNVLEFAKQEGVAKVVFPSSGSVYGNANYAQSETSPTSPSNLYGAVKLASEDISRGYPEIDTIALRIFAGYGPGESHKKSFASAVTLFLNSILTNERPIIFGNGTQSRDFIYIDDVVHAIIRCVETDLSGLLNVGSGESHSFNQVLDMLKVRLGSKILPRYVPKPQRYLERTLADNKSMIMKLGFVPLNLSKGIDRYIGSLSKGGRETDA